MARPVTVAVCATPGKPSGETDDEKHESNLTSAEALLAEAAGKGADIACLPETFAVQGIPRAGENARWYEPFPDGPIGMRFSEVARKHGMYVIAPILGLEHNIRRNIALIFDRNGNYLGGYRKVHITVAERKAWHILPGDSWPVFDLDFGRIGITICYDVLFPEAFRILALKGAEIIFHPTVYSMFGEVGWEAMIQSRAIDNCVYLCPVNYGIGDTDPWMPGKCLNRSSIIGPDGIVLADRGRYQGVATAELDLDRPRMVLSGVRYRDKIWNHRRPDTYSELTTYGPWVKNESPIDPPGEEP
ncbi:MAG: carbon-nitrogen hydrolase family protein [bacterium]|nr:carbon-nitrogen hydrolase family protein [bacterium]